MPEFDPFSPLRHPTPGRPLLGLTILIVEDSRYASDAMRLLCLRSGARIRRADSIRAAERHLQVYRPSVVIVDIGLPDGSGAGLIEALNRTTPRIDVILGTSGDDMSEALCHAAGADGFFPKPVQSLALFQQTILAHLPEDRRPTGPRPLPDDVIQPDFAAYQDDMVHAADILSDHNDEAMIDYIAQFVTGVARSAGDMPLVEAGEALSGARASHAPSRAEAARLAGLLQDRITARVAI
jgi:CheY-like chemotaxis protein